ncbi:MAG: tetratricopeptide repeat protein [Candidatus Omnitrophica bacterium]|nr:tetratricopeptide repeat protein [Candidatus Omnitrophota bacterium]
MCRTHIARAAWLPGILSDCILAVCALGLVSSALCWAQSEADPYLARQAFNDGFYEVAARQFEELLNNPMSRPEQNEIVLMLAQSYMHLGKYALALHRLEALLDRKDNPDEIRSGAMYWMAEVYVHHKDFRKAREWYDKVTEAFPTLPISQHAQYSRAWTYVLEGDFAGAYEQFSLLEGSLSNLDLLWDVRFKRAQCLFHLGNWAAAAADLEEYLAKVPNTVHTAEALFHLGSCYEEMGRYVDAANAYRACLDAPDRQQWAPHAAYSGAWALYKAGVFEESLELFELTKQLFAASLPEDSLDYGIASCLKDLGRDGEAIDYLRRLLNSEQISEWRARAALTLGQMQYKKELYAESAESFRKGLALCPDPMGALKNELRYQMGWAATRLGEMEEALSLFQKVADSGSDALLRVSAWCRIGEAYFDQEEYESAVHAYDQVLKDFPESYLADQAQYYLGWALLKQEKFDAAVLAFKSLLANYPASSWIDDALFRLGAAYYQKRDYERAQEHFARLVQEYPESLFVWEARFQQANCLFNRGEYKAAAVLYEQVFRSAPSLRSRELASYQMGWTAHHQGFEDLAFAIFQDHVNSFPESPLRQDCLFWLAEQKYNRGLYAEAREAFDQLLNEGPRHELVDDALYWIAWSFVEEGNQQEAQEIFVGLAQEFPGSPLAPEAAMAAASLAKENGDLHFAEDQYVWVKTNYPGTRFEAMAQNQLAQLFQDRGRLEDAVGMLQDALKEAPDALAPELQYRIGDCYEGMGNLDNALLAYLKVDYLYPQQEAWVSRARLRAAQIFEDRSQWQQATNMYQKLVQGDVELAAYASERLGWIRKNQDREEGFDD